MKFSTAAVTVFGCVVFAEGRSMRAAQYQAPCPTDDVAAGGLYPDAAPATPEYTVAPADAAAA